MARNSNRNIVCGASVVGFSPYHYGLDRTRHQNFARKPTRLSLTPPSLQLLSGSTYSAPYVAVDFDPDLTSNPSGRLLAPCTRGAHAAPAQRGPWGGVRIWHDREHLRRSDFLGIDQSHSLSRSDLFRGNVAAHFFDGKAKPGAPGWCSRKRSQEHKTAAQCDSLGHCFLHPCCLLFAKRIHFPFGHKQSDRDSGSNSHDYAGGSTNGYSAEYRNALSLG
jgi:hypothetical protein